VYTHPDLCRGVRCRQQGTHDARVGQVHAVCLDPGRPQAIQGQQENLEISLQPGMAVDLGTELQRLAGGMGLVGPCVQHGAAVTQPGHAGAVEQVRVDACHLGGAVGPQAHHAPGELVDELEGLQVQGLAGTAEQRLQMLQQGGHDQLVTVAARHVQQVTAQFFDVARLGRQHIGNMIRQDPGRHGM